MLPRKHKRIPIRLAPIVVLIIACESIALPMLAEDPVPERSASLHIADVQTNSTTVGRFGKFEITFSITGTVATHLDWPYDPSPPPGLPAGVGITVDGLFSDDNWITTYSQPAFLYQPYTYTVHNSYDHLYPSGAPVWMIRFAPPTTGVWQYRIQAIDDSGTLVYPTEEALSFTVVPSDSLGFLRVSQMDPRYFEYQNGTPFIGVGHNEGFPRPRFIQDATEKFSQFEAHRVNFFRVWMSSNSIGGSAWWPWSTHHLDYDGYLPATSLTIEETYGDGDVAMRLDMGNPCMYQGFRYPISVLPGRVYRIRVRFKTTNISGPAEPGEPYGFVVKVGDWLAQECSSPAAGTPVTPYVVDTGDAWQMITGTLTTASDQYFLGNLYLTQTNAQGGSVYVDEVWLEEQLGPDSYGPNVLPKSRVNVHTYFDPVRSWQWDQVLDEAAAHGVYLKLVILEKNEWIYNRITPSGSMTSSPSNNNFYAGPDTKVRWLHEAWWRYLIARWGYSTSVHSWELLNEGDPFNGNHHDQAQAFAEYVHTHDPNRHMVTTSNWHSFPVAEFWGNAAYPDLDYADLHAYISTGWGEYPIWGNGPPYPLEFEDSPLHTRGGSGYSLRISGSQSAYNAPVAPSRLAIRGAGEWTIRYWMKAEGFVGSCSYGDPDTLSGPRLVWTLDNGQPGSRSNVVPPSPSGRDYRCSAPSGTYSWTQFDIAHTAAGGESPISARLIITDDQTHTLHLGVQNAFGSGGTAWIDDIEIIAPDGTVLATNGSVDLDSMLYDAALYTSAYSRLWGGASPAGAGMPVVRGEAGLDHPGGPQEELDDLAQDVEGVWLHNLIWGGINPGGMYELYWWTDNIRDHNLYYHWEPYRDFMDGIPLNNGNYRDAEPLVSHPDLRAWGQKDTVHGRAHLWIQNRDHTWRNVVDGVSVPQLSGQITITDLPQGLYQVEWWNTYSGAIIETIVIETSSGDLVLDLPAPLDSDVAVKVDQLTTSLGLSTKTVNRSIAHPTDVLTYNIAVINAGTLGATITATDEIPASTTYVMGSARVTPDSGELSDSADIHWTGELGAGGSVTITFAVQVEAQVGTSAIVNTAVIETASERIERSALTIVNPSQVFLPLVRREKYRHLNSLLLPTEPLARMPNLRPRDPPAPMKVGGSLVL